MVAQSFGDKHTIQKLETVQKYLQAYVTALKFQQFNLLYVDACAGSGSSIPKAGCKSESDDFQVNLYEEAAPVLDTDEIIVGSAIRALSVKPPFHRYLLNDLKKSNVEALKDTVKDGFQEISDRVHITQLDANNMLRDLCRNENWKTTRAVVFLDPFGLQIDYETIVMLGRTEAIDLWYLVPVFAMYRQVSGDGQLNPDGAPRVDAALGTTDWRNVAVIADEGPGDLLNQRQLRSKRAVDIAWFEKIAKDRIGAAFGGRVLEETLPLGRGKIQEFSLMFAWANPSDRAKLAAKLAKAILA